MLNRVKQLMEQGEDFAFETTLATKSYVSYIKKAKEKNYNITLVFIYLNSTALAKQRVKERVQKGGHNIEESVIMRRYESGLKNFFQLYAPLSDFWILVDNSSENYELYEIASGEFGQIKSILNHDLWNTIKENYGTI